VYIVCVSTDLKTVLNKFEDDWSTSHRSIALDKEKKKRKNRPNGYLSVWPKDVVSEFKKLQKYYVEFISPPPSLPKHTS
jgi:hypothetical protein